MNGARGCLLALSIASTSLGADTLRLGIVQTAVENTFEENAGKMVRFITEARSRKCRVAVFPEGAISQEANPDPRNAAIALDRIKDAARQAGIYVVFGGKSLTQSTRDASNWMMVLDPNGREIFRYEKLYDRPGAPMPGVFLIDGIPFSAMICADRWLRGVEELPVIQGARVSIELSNNFEMEWVPQLQWYWYVPRALRNSIYVVFANTANGRAANPSGPRHGHSAVVAPDGRVVAAIDGDSERMLVANIDVGKASRAAAQARRTHPALASFWEAGLDAMAGKSVSATAVVPYTSPEVELKIAGAQFAPSRRISENVSKMEEMIGAAADGVSVMAFPELAVTGAIPVDIRRAPDSELSGSLERIRLAAKRKGIYVVFGMPFRVLGRLRNSAFAIGPDGALLTRYDQMASDHDLFEAGSDPKSMWFRVNGVPAVVTIGNDGAWSEIAELAALAGAQAHFHITHDRASGPKADLRRMQVWANLASFKTFTATVNAASPDAAGGSAIWDDLAGTEEVREVLKARRLIPHPSLHIFSSFSANCITRAGAGEQIIYATRRMNRRNPHNAVQFNPQMSPWFSFGAELIGARAGF